MAQQKKFQIVFIASEVGPWSKTGGLGEVMDGLPIALAAKGHRVMTIAPRWDQYYDAWDTSVVADLPMGSKEDGEDCRVRFFHCYKQKVDRVFIDHPIFLEKVWGQTGQKYYGPAWGLDWNDSQVRFSLFARSALAAIKTVPVGGFPYGENCVIVCNDWHSCLVPMYMTMDESHWRKTKICLLIHNMVYQGRFCYEPWMADAFNLPESVIQEMRCCMPVTLSPGAPKVDCVNWLSGSLRYFDKLLTVSPSYAEAVMSNPVMGVELNEDLKTHRGGGIRGILNGIKDGCSPAQENMQRTANLLCRYDENSLENRIPLKKAFQEKVGLPVRPDVPLFMFLGRLDFQKGVDIMLAALQDKILPTQDIQFVVIGQGREDLIAKLTSLSQEHPNKFATLLSFKGPDKFAAYAACDFAVMPSRYEPCGLVQMESMRFGVLPLVTPTGGLKDTVEHMETGIVFRAEIEYDSKLCEKSAEVVAAGILQAVELFGQEGKRREMQKRAMVKSRGFTWARAADEYLEVFGEIGGQCVKEVGGGLESGEVGEDEVV